MASLVKLWISAFKYWKFKHLVCLSFWDISRDPGFRIFNPVEKIWPLDCLWRGSLMLMYARLHGNNFWIIFGHSGHCARGRKENFWLNLGPDMQLLFRPVMSLIQSHQSWLYNPLVTHSHLSKVPSIRGDKIEFWGFKAIFLTPIGMRQGTFHPSALSPCLFWNQILSAEFVSKISKLFGGEN